MHGARATLQAAARVVLQQLRLDAGEFGIALEQRLEAGGILLPQRLPECGRLIGRFELAVHRGLRLAGITARQLLVQISDLVAQDFGDRRALARREVGVRKRAQLAENSFEDLRDIGQRKRVRPLLRAFRVGECERRRGNGGSGRAVLRRNCARQHR